jgi:hypothetical protein
MPRLGLLDPIEEGQCPDDAAAQYIDGLKVNQGGNIRKM